MPYIAFSDSSKRNQLEVRQPWYGMPGPAIATLTVKAHSRTGTTLEENADFRRMIGMLQRDPITGKSRSEKEARIMLNGMVKRAYDNADAVLTAVRRSSEMAKGQQR